MLPFNFVQRRFVCFSKPFIHYLTPALINLKIPFSYGFLFFKPLPAQQHTGSGGGGDGD
jgi:hypothetical protein